MTTRTRDDLSVSTTESSSWYRHFKMAASTRYAAATSRILIGFVFLWAFLDKNFGLEYATASGNGWAFGSGEGDPTFGFLKFGTNPEGPFASTFTGLRPGEAPDPTNFWNYLFMAGLLGIGLSLILGVFMRIAAISGAVLLGLMYLATFPLANTIDPKTGEGAFNNPLIDDHIIYAVVLIMLMLFEAGRTWGLGKIWESTSLVKSQPWLA